MKYIGFKSKVKRYCFSNLAVKEDKPPPNIYKVEKSFIKKPGFKHTGFN